MRPIRTNIEIRNGTILCTPKDGHVRAAQRTELEWVSQGEEFTLSFTLLGGGSAWPFKEPQPPVFQPTKAFKGTLRDVTAEAPAYKYTVRMGAKLLDPIIIVDK
ncbi:MAG TPA: hypothetical protein VGD47_04040 [Steroidobacteraceae bacterium]